MAPLAVKVVKSIFDIVWHVSRSPPVATVWFMFTDAVLLQV